MHRGWIFAVLALLALRCGDAGGDLMVLLKNPQWSPGGSLLAVLHAEYNSGTGGGCSKNTVVPSAEPLNPIYDLYLTTIDGTLNTKVASGGNDIRTVRWSPDGSRVIMTNLGGSNGVTIATQTGNAVVVDSLGSAADADWSPDGSHVLVAAIKLGDTERKVYEIDAQGTSVTLLQGLPSNVGSVQWSAVNRIALLYQQDYRGYLGFANADGSGFQVIDSVGLVFSTIDWSPDGSQLIYTASAAPYRLYRLDPVTKQRTQLGPGGSFYETIGYSPDGTRILYGNAYGLYVVDTDGNNEQTVSTSAHEASWSPDSRHLVYVVDNALQTSLIQ
jgi:Tol biopolymer transport system component